MQPEAVTQEAVEPTSPANEPSDPTPADTFDQGAFNPDQLPPELQPGWRQLQAAYTRKTQELAEERRQLEALTGTLGNPEQVREAMELFTAIQNPQNWVQLHAELSDAMQQFGLTPAQADQAAAEALAETQSPTPDLSGLADDPDLAPLAKRLEEMQSRLDHLDAERQHALVAREAELEQRQIMASLVEDVNQIRSANPTYDDDDIASILEISSYHNGDVFAAQQSYEAGVQRRLGRYLAGKQSAQEVAQSQAPAGSTAHSTPVEGEETTDDVAAWMEEHVRQLQAAGELDY